MASPAGSPSKKVSLPPSIANASLEELQKLFVDSLKKLKARDRKIAELTSVLDSQQVAVNGPGEASDASHKVDPDLEQQLQEANQAKQAAERLAAAAEEQYNQLYQQQTAHQQQAADAAAQGELLQEQLAALKDGLRQTSQQRDASAQVRTGLAHMATKQCA